MADLIIAIVFTVIATAALFMNEDKIALWQEKHLKK